jgi:hypothetical protein
VVLANLFVALIALAKVVLVGHNGLAHVTLDLVIAILILLGLLR